MDLWIFRQQCVNGIGSLELPQFGLLTTSTGGKMIAGGIFRQLDEKEPL